MTAPTAQVLSGLEGQLRQITDQIETLRRPGVEEAIAALRAELGEIGRTLNERCRVGPSKLSRGRFRT